MGTAKTPKRTIVLGEQFAAAQEAERHRLAKPHEESPLGNTQYDKWRGELRLSDLRPVPLDGRIAQMCGAFAAAEAGERDRTRASLNLQDLYTLLTFSRRASVFALRRGQADLSDGLVAVSMVDPDRVDTRDIAWALGLLQHAATRWASEQHATALFERAASLADPRVAKLIRSQGAERVQPNNIRTWGYSDLNTADGPGLIRWGFRSYRPTHDLASVGLDIARLVDAQGYLSDDPELACDVPAVWLQPGSRAGGAVPSVLAAVHVFADRRLVGSDTSWSDQGLMVWIAEMRNATEASALTSRAVHPTGGGFVRHSLSVGRLFCLIVQSSAMYGVAPVETEDSIKRFGQPIERILRKRVRPIQ